ncbi:hypothetical protein UFOVP139_23 [uncultured Caudovirales phage]|uniref:AAA domain containing protein n=1 Tax=uncultured Caudovirales phage TaxID=2100421 RepID=A0A6J5LC99_9CAUD|nr:hypothetical protein UFOVP139_23 [uncultured Caudovirales phage]
MKKAIFSLRGTSGSGKTTVAREFFSRYPVKTIPDPNGKKKPWGYEVDASKDGITQPIYLIGSYETVCGGCDNVSTQAEIVERTMAAHGRGHVFIEGLLLSKAGPGGQTTQAFAPTGDYSVGWLDTPLETCLERVVGRRQARGDERPFDPTNTIDAYTGIRQACVNLHKANIGVRVLTVPHTDAFNTVLDVYKQAERE